MRSTRFPVRLIWSPGNSHERNFGNFVWHFERPFSLALVPLFSVIFAAVVHQRRHDKVHLLIARGATLLLPHSFCLTFSRYYNPSVRYSSVSETLIGVTRPRTVLTIVTLFFLNRFPPHNTCFEGHSLQLLLKAQKCRKNFLWKYSTPEKSREREQGEVKP